MPPSGINKDDVKEPSSAFTWRGTSRYEVLTVGGAMETPYFPDEIFRSAILTNSRYIILIHNHPSGDANPSGADIEAMALLRTQAEVLGRTMLDFIIVGERGYWSAFERIDGDDYAAGGLMK